MDQDIVPFARREYNLFLGERTAEDIKIAIGSAYPGDWDAQRVTPSRPRPAHRPAAQRRGRRRPDPRGDRAVGPADRRHDQGHDRGDAAGARRRHHGPGHRPRRRRRAARGARPAHRRGDPDAGPHRRRPADLRRPRHRRSSSRSSSRRWSASSSPTPTRGRRADRGDWRPAPRMTSPSSTSRDRSARRRRSRSSALLAVSLGPAWSSRRARPSRVPARRRVRVPARSRAALDDVAGGVSAGWSARSPRSTRSAPTNDAAAPRRTPGCRPRTPGPRSSSARTSMLTDAAPAARARSVQDVAAHRSSPAKRPSSAAPSRSTRAPTTGSSDGDVVDRRRRRAGRPGDRCRTGDSRRDLLINDTSSTVIGQLGDERGDRRRHRPARRRRW